MTQINQLMQSEAANLDHDQLGTLYAQLGNVGAEDVLRRAMEELALRLSHSERLYQQGEMPELRKSVQSLIAIAEQIGMRKLARVAGDVGHAADHNDMVAVAATLSRLMRVGEASLTAVWDLQDMTI